MNERVLLASKSFLGERDKNFSEIQSMKKSLSQLKEDTARISQLLQRIIEQLNSAARKDELMILQRQFDLFRK
jgi:GTP1/Obg family GTP-binding protein